MGGSRHRPPSRNRNHSNQKHSAPKTHNEPAADAGRSACPIDSAIAPQSSSDEQHRADERSFWKKQICVAKGLNWITGGAGAIALVGLIFVAIGLFDNREATVAANRAWITAQWGGVKFAAPNWLFEITLTNVGKEPAIDINFTTPVTSFVDLINTDLGEETNWPTFDTCEGIKPLHHGMVVYPAPAVGRREVLGSQITPDMRDNLAALLAGRKGVLVVGCVAYNSFRAARYTQYCFLEKKMPDGTMTAVDCRHGGYAN